MENAKNEVRISVHLDVARAGNLILVNIKARTFNSPIQNIIAMMGYRIAPHPIWAGSFKNAIPNSRKIGGVNGKATSNAVRYPFRRKKTNGTKNAIQILIAMAAREK
ncbi:hypothetical protein [Herbaspirillum rhizosphaerae]|uniref:hypothetical protein n=1 Tax=Herbaspirillum rhizosphaerae TaxID=346179 RepID=UPI0012ED4421|nr:hypothetical protein [Herbaspirillum rhizosphaerae]